MPDCLKRHYTPAPHELFHKVRMKQNNCRQGFARGITVLGMDSNAEDVDFACLNADDRNHVHPALQPKRSQMKRNIR